MFLLVLTADISYLDQMINQSRCSISKLIKKYIILKMSMKVYIFLLLFKFSQSKIGPISALAITPNGKTVISASRDRSIKMFDVSHQKEIHHFRYIHEGNFDY